jgi:2-oxoglutarate ferredoxin oxidoreductase subunit delta
MSHPVVDYKKCKSNFVCLEVCPMGVFAKENNKIVVKNPSACIGCRACEIQCPEKAIKVVDD